MLCGLVGGYNFPPENVTCSSDMLKTTYNHMAPQSGRPKLQSYLVCSHSSENAACVTLHFNAVWYCRWLPTFQRNVLLPPSE
jgi:hypothetical protein